MQEVNNSKEDFSDIVKKTLGFTDEDIEIIKKYLDMRSEEVKGEGTFGIVYDITQYCNLNCIHCCVNAKFVSNKEKIKFETTYEQSCLIIDQTHDYIKENKINKYFLMFGGGEPFLHPGSPEILQYASEILGSEHIGVNTNGTLISLEDIRFIKKYMSIIEISIDGFEEHHNRWRDPLRLSKIDNPFRKSFQLAKHLASDNELSKLLEVSAIATKDNIQQLAKFMEYLYKNGIKTASIHRCIPVGRMANYMNKVPNLHDYGYLLLDIAKLRNRFSDFKIHIHHSLESIYSTLLLGYDIHLSRMLGCSKRHSIGIDWNGNVFFDPWAIVPPYNKLNAGNILKKDLEEIIHNPKSPIQIADRFIRRNTRCEQCKLACSGGMRFSALADYIGDLTKVMSKITIAYLIFGLSQMDPACPLYSEYPKSADERGDINVFPHEKQKTMGKLR